MAETANERTTDDALIADALPLPEGWRKQVKAAVVQVVALAQFSLGLARGQSVNGGEKRERQAVDVDRMEQELSLVLEEMRIKDARMGRVASQRRPHYSAVERLAILELRAARGWSLAETARRFLVTHATISSWGRRLDKEGADGLLALREPVNKFPDFVRYTVQRLKTLCPSLGKVKIAEILCRAGLHLGVTSVGRILKEKPTPAPHPPAANKHDRVVTAKYPNHIWHTDLTLVPIVSGFWTAWLPFALPQCWPFCWWAGVVLDHYSRRAMGVALFRQQPTSEMVRAFLGRTISSAAATPKYIICDQGTQFSCSGFLNWCDRRSIKPRFGAIGKQGSIAVVERYIKTLKDEATLRILVPLNHSRARHEILSFLLWYNNFRPHMTLGGKTPNEVYNKQSARIHKPRIEPRVNWPRPSPCAKPQVLIAGQSGDRFEMDVSHLAGRSHLPIVTLRRAA